MLLVLGLEEPGKEKRPLQTKWHSEQQGRGEHAQGTWHSSAGESCRWEAINARKATSTRLDRAETVE